MLPLRLSVFPMSTSESYLYPPILPATEQDFFDYRNSSIPLQDHLGPEKPYIRPVSTWEITNILTQGELIDLSPVAATFVDSFRMRRYINGDLRDDLGVVWNDLSDIDRAYIEDKFLPVVNFEDDPAPTANDVVAYEDLYLAQLIKHCLANQPRPLQQFFGKNAEALTQEYNRLHLRGSEEVKVLVNQASQRVISALQAGKIRNIQADWGIERISQLQFLVQDPYSFRKTFATKFDHSIKPSELGAYYSHDIHAVVLPSWLEEHIQNAEKLIVHEILHALSAASYVKTGNVITTKRVGLLSYSALKPTGENTARSTHTILNEFAIESEARACMGLAPESPSGVYASWRQLGWTLIRLAEQLDPASDYEDTLMSAVFEQPQSDQHTPGRWPATKLLGQETARIFGAGFLNRLDCFVATHGTARALELLNEPDWRKIEFQKYSNHHRHVPNIR